MAVSITNLFTPVQLGATVTTIYSVSTTPKTNVLSRGRVRFTNTDTVPHAITAYGVPAGGTAGASNAFMNAESLGSNDHVDIDVPLLGPGGTLQAFADMANTVTIHAIDGILFS